MTNKGEWYQKPHCTHTNEGKNKKRQGPIWGAMSYAKKYTYYLAASSAKNFYDAIAPARYEIWGATGLLLRIINTMDAYSLYATVEESICDARTTVALRQGPYRTTLLYANRREPNQIKEPIPLSGTRRRSTESIGYTFYGIGLYDIDYYLLSKTPDANHSKGYNKDGKAPTDCVQHRVFYEAIALHGISGLPTSLARNTKRTLSTP